MNVFLIETKHALDILLLSDTVGQLLHSQDTFLLHHLFQIAAKQRLLVKRAEHTDKPLLRHSKLVRLLHDELAMDGRLDSDIGFEAAFVEELHHSDIVALRLFKRRQVLSQFDCALEPVLELAFADILFVRAVHRETFRRILLHAQVLGLMLVVVHHRYRRGHIAAALRVQCETAVGGHVSVVFVQSTHRFFFFVHVVLIIVVVFFIVIGIIVSAEEAMR
mmetsp:Transcript_40931/g.65791  ORF Transcript_40931/g.65791 Transcript_40931/m.65791 type:complete len:220 (+) Transcript_40931:1031-1690(+)